MMTAPLVVLAVLSAIGGLTNTPIRLTLEHFLEPSFEGVQIQHVPDSTVLVIVLALLSVAAGLAGIVAAYVSYRRDEKDWREFEDGLQPVWGVWADAYGIDDVYGKAIVAPGKKAAEAAAFGFDIPVIDGAVNGVGRLFQRLGEWTRPIQTGYVRNYAALFLGGTVLVVLWMLMGGA